MLKESTGRSSRVEILLKSPHVSLEPRPDVRQGLLTRRTFRTFERRAIPARTLASVVESARWAWTPGHAALVRLIVLDDPVLKRRLFKLTRESKDISNHHLASAAATENLALAARYHGMALVMYTHFSQEKLKQLLDVPFDWDVMGVMGIGYPDLKRANPRVLVASLTRFPLSELVSNERYGEPAPKDLIEERDAEVPMPDLMTTMLGLRMATRFKDDPVLPEYVFELLRAARWAPSAGNFQPVRYVVLRERERLATLQELARESVEISGHWFPHYRERSSEHPDWTQVPLAIALIADPTKGGPHIHGEATHMHAGGLAVQNMALMAHALGLGTALVTHWIEEKVKVLIDCPRTWDLVGVMPFGFPADALARNPKLLDELVYQDAFGRPWDRTREILG